MKVDGIIVCLMIILVGLFINGELWNIIVIKFCCV